MKSIRHIIESQQWKVLKVKQGYSGMVRVDALHLNTGERYSRWLKKKYVDRFSKEHYGKLTHDLSFWEF